MTAITPEFLHDLESNMQAIMSREYERLLGNLWWTKVAKTKQSVSKKDRLLWLLDTARIERPNASHGGGQQIFEDIVSLDTEIESENAVAGLKLKREQLEDVFNGTPGGEGLELAGHWSRQVGVYSAYWPQKMIADAIKSNLTAYDGKSFFATDHPVNPFDSGAGEYANHFTGAASGIYPGAVPIDDSVTLDVAVANIAKALAYVASIKMPNGEDPRMLRLGHLIAPPALAARVRQITNAKTIDATDFEAVISGFGLGEPIIAEELGSAFGGSDDTYYLAVQDVATDDLGALIYLEREPFSVIMHGDMTTAELARKREFQWTTEGRNVAQAGHPYLLFRADAS